jgi:hypothetical protein
MVRDGLQRAQEGRLVGCQAASPGQQQVQVVALTFPLAPLPGIAVEEEVAGVWVAIDRK